MDSPGLGGAGDLGNAGEALVTERSADPIELLEALIRIPSVNPSIAPDEATGEAAIADFIQGWLADRGVAAVLEEVTPGRPNVVATIGRRAVDPSAPGKTVVFCGHIDTVGTAGMPAPFEPRRDGNRLHGRGSTDMKAGVAAAMAACVRLQREWGATGRADRAGAGAGGSPGAAPQGPSMAPGTVMLALVADEEYTSLGADHFVANHRADACILTESSDGALIVAHKGFVWLRIRTHGRAAHGSRWEIGSSAIGPMGRLIDALERFDRETLRARVHAVVGPASMHCALIEGGVGISTYAPQCVLRVERRTLPDETPEQVAREIRELAASVGVEADVEIEFSRSSMQADPSSPIVCATSDAVEAITGTAPEKVGRPYWLDSAVFAAAGIPTVDYGPTGHGEHETVEWVEIDSVVRTADVLVEAAKRFLAGR